MNFFNQNLFNCEILAFISELKCLTLFSPERGVGLALVSPAPPEALLGCLFNMKWSVPVYTA